MQIEKGAKYKITKPDGDWKGAIYIWDIKGDKITLKSDNGSDVCVDIFNLSEIAGLGLKKTIVNHDLEDFYGYDLIHLL